MPDFIDRVGAELLHAANADPLPAEQRQGWPGWHVARWWAVRVVPLAAAAAAAVGVISALPSTGPVVVPAASAKVILAKAAAVVAGSDGVILHADSSTTQTWQDGYSDHSTEQDWQQVSPPYDSRSIVTSPTGTVETAYVNGKEWLYDTGTNTIYTNEPPPGPGYNTLTAGPRPGTYTLHTGHGSSAVSLTVTASQAAALRDGRDVVAIASQGGVIVVPRLTAAPQLLSSFRPEALTLLRSPTSKVTRNVTIDGQNALKLTTADGSITYYVDPSTYAPIQITSPVPTDGLPSNRGTVTTKFSDWRYLTGAAANPRLLSLTAQHPDATIDHSAADYNAAESRLFP